MSAAVAVIFVGLILIERRELLRGGGSPFRNLQRFGVHLADHSFAGEFREPDVALLVELDAVRRARFGELHEFFLLWIEAQENRSAGPDVSEAIEAYGVHAAEADRVHPA